MLPVQQAVASLAGAAVAAACLCVAAPGIGATTGEAPARTAAMVRHAAAAASTVLPTIYKAGHFFAVPETRDGHQLTLVVDTGGGGFGGMYWISAAAARRLQLKTHTCSIGGQKATVSALPDYRPHRGLPPPLGGPCGKAVFVQAGGSQSGSVAYDGQLGAAYLHDRVWTFDYPAHRLTLDGATWHPDSSAHATRLGVQRDANGRPTTGFARVVIRVDGQSLDMLLDTGATAHPTAAGAKASHTPTVNGYGVTSYIVRSVFERWHKAHPHWRVVKDGDDVFGPKHPTPIIEVPSVEIGGWSVGPVWFTVRPDRAFYGGSRSMSQWMDKKVSGAVGGNVFRHFVMTIDYPHAKAWFRCVRGCRAAAGAATQQTN